MLMAGTLGTDNQKTRIIQTRPISLITPREVKNCINYKAQSIQYACEQHCNFSLCHALLKHTQKLACNRIDASLTENCNDRLIIQPV